MLKTIVEVQNTLLYIENNHNTNIDLSDVIDILIEVVEEQHKIIKNIGAAIILDNELLEDKKIVFDLIATVRSNIYNQYYGIKLNDPLVIIFDEFIESLVSASSITKNEKTLKEYYILTIYIYETIRRNKERDVNYIFDEKYELERLRLYKDKINFSIINVINIMYKYIVDNSIEF